MRKLTHFDGLRGLAAFIVFLAHFRPTFCLNINNQVLDAAGITGEKSRAFAQNLLSLFYEGALPVFIFWFMSAYVISVKLFNNDSTKSEKYLIEASTKRYFRLAIPVFVSSLFVFLLLKANLIYNSTLATQLGKGFSDGWLNQQYHFDAGFIHFLRITFIEVFINGNCNYNFVLWTMAPELLGSFLCFGLFAVIGRNSQRYIVYVIAVILLTFGGFREVTYFFYLTFVIGLLWCDVMNSNDEAAYKPVLKKLFTSTRFTIELLILSFVIPIYSDVIHPLPANLYSLFAFPVKAIAITLSVHQFTAIRNLFSTTIFRFMGKISFSLYLLHIPVLFSLGAWLYLYAGIPAPYKLPVVFVAVSAALIVMSYLFERYIDKGAIKLATRVGKFFSSSKDNTPKITIIQATEQL